MADLAELLEGATITDTTLIYSDEANFPHEGWEKWENVSLTGRASPELSRGGCAWLHAAATLHV